MKTILFAAILILACSQTASAGIGNIFWTPAEVQIARIQAGDRERERQHAERAGVFLAPAGAAFMSRGYTVRSRSFYAAPPAYRGYGPYRSQRRGSVYSRPYRGVYIGF